MKTFLVSCVAIGVKDMAIEAESPEAAEDTLRAKISGLKGPVKVVDPDAVANEEESPEAALKRMAERIAELEALLKEAATTGEELTKANDALKAENEKLTKEKPKTKSGK